jgi:hypothetical protein
LQSHVPFTVRILILACVGVLAPVAAAHAATIYVAQNGKAGAAGTARAPLSTVQAGIDRAGPGDTVRVRRGVFRERVSFPRDGASGKPITLAGEKGAIIDGGTPVSGTAWERVTGSGGNIYRAPYTGPQPYNLTWNNKYILRIRDEFMAVEGMTTLREGPRGWDTYGGTVYRSWDGVSAMWGTLNGYLYVGFGDAGVDPRREEIATAPSDRNGGAAITIDGRKFITVRGLTVRNGYAAILVRNNAADCVIEKNTCVGGWHTVQLMKGVSRVVVRNNEVTLGYGHSLDPDDPRHWFIWAAFKLNSDWDRICVDLSNVGSDNEVSGNHLYENFDGVQNEGSGVRLNVHDNLIERLADDGLEPDGEETEARWHDNIVRQCNIAYRHKGITGSGPMYVYRNRFYSTAGDAHNEALGIYFFGGSTTTAYIYHNTIATTQGAAFGSTRVELGLPNVWLVNNLFSCTKSFPDNRRWSIKPHVEYNYWGGELAAGLPWWGATNKIVPNGRIWSVASEPDYRLSRTSAAREVGVDLSRPWSVAGTTHPALDGMPAGYFAGARPDAGALQYPRSAASAAR